MGNCLSKYPMKFEIAEFRDRKIKSFNFQNGHNTEEKARSLGVYAVNREFVLTPVNDRFPAQAFDLEVYKFQGFVDSKGLVNNCRKYFNN